MYELAWKDRDGWLRAEGVDPPPPPADLAVDGVALLHWEEHCVECSAPECFSTCGLYLPRRDTACARFDHGIYPNPVASGAFPFAADIRFRRWGKLEAKWPTAPRVYPVSRLRRLAEGLSLVERGLAGRTRIPGYRVFADRLNDRVDRFSAMLRRRLAEGKGTDLPDALYVKFFSSSEGQHRLNLEILLDQPVWRKSLSVAPGWNEHWIPLDPRLFSQGGDQRLIRLWPDRDEELRLIFTWLDCVRSAETEETELSRRPAAKVKCVAWDLDETLWNGTIGDAGGRHVDPSNEVLALVQSLDERGILQTVVSKNEYAVAWEKIVELGLEEMFLCPAIHWGPKSESLRQISEALNIGLDSFLLIDDSEFERGEVSSVFREVRVCDPAEITDLLARPEFDVPVTEEGRTRRQKYIEQGKRDRILRSWRGDYDAFLRGCEMTLEIVDPGGTRRERSLELLQRSNQFNLSGERYTGEELDALLDGDAHECFAFEVQDRYGHYGTVGFAAIEKSAGAYTFRQFVMSCRVAGKRVEETVILWFADRARAQGVDTLAMHLRDTGRNRPLRSSLEALNFSSRRVEDNELLLELSLSEEIEVPDVIGIRC